MDGGSPGGCVTPGGVGFLVEARHRKSRHHDRPFRICAGMGVQKEFRDR
jgi:hypothetical protein